MEFDKSKSCMGCPDRTAVCHGICEEYLKRFEDDELRRNERHERAERKRCMENYIADRIRRCKKSRK